MRAFDGDSTMISGAPAATLVEVEVAGVEPPLPAVLAAFRLVTGRDYTPPPTIPNMDMPRLRTAA